MSLKVGFMKKLYICLVLMCVGLVQAQNTSNELKEELQAIFNAEDVEIVSETETNGVFKILVNGVIVVSECVFAQVSEENYMINCEQGGQSDRQQLKSLSLEVENVSISSCERETQTKESIKGQFYEPNWDLLRGCKL